MAKHYVTYRVHGTYTAEVEANDIKEALAKADIAFSEADFGESANIDGSPAFVEDEAGNPLWEEGNPIPGHEDEYYFCDAEEEREWRLQESCNFLIKILFLFNRWNSF